MIVISHRGNIHGPNPAHENTMSQILECINKNIQVEIDVWRINQSLMLGHDEPQYQLPLAFLLDYKDMLWIHCKNLDAFEYLTDFAQFNVFWHQNDDCTLTTKGSIWTYPNKPVTAKSVIVCQDVEQTKKYFSHQIRGICTDFVSSVINVL